jgi:hypothetical protein
MQKKNSMNTWNETSVENFIDDEYWYQMWLENTGQKDIQEDEHIGI